MNLSKNHQFLVFVIKNSPEASITSLMKLSYLIDLISVKKLKKQISKFTYKRYRFGPFDEKIYNELDSLIKKGIISATTDYTPTGEEFIRFSIKNEDINFSKLDDKERKIILEVIENLKGYGAKTLTEIAYKTKPMKELGATIDGEENLNKKLNLAL